MRSCLIILALVLAGCGRDVPVPVSPQVPADLLVGCPGHTGPSPRTERQLILAAAAEKRGRQCANLKIETLAGMIGPQ